MLTARFETQERRQDDMRQQLDKDRTSIDEIIIELGKNTDITERLLKQMEDFKQTIRDMVKETIAQEVPSAVKSAVAEELNHISMNNPRKSFVVYYGIAEVFKNIRDFIKSKLKR